MADQKKNGLVLRAAVVAFALLVFGFCAWSMHEYVQGRDPLAFALGSDALQTVEEESLDAAVQVAQHDAKESSAEDAEDAEGVADDVEKNEASSTGAVSEDASTTGSDAAASTSTTTKTVTTTQTHEAAPSQQPQDTNITVTITVDGSAAGAGASSATLSLSPGASVYDALASAGVSVNAKSTGYGMYVSAIGGLAEKDHGGMSGWVYAVNGAEPNVACSGYTLHDGDSIVWTYVNVEY